MISQLALFFFLLLFCATNGLSHGLQVSGSKEVLGRHLHIVLGFVKLTAALAQVLDVSPHALSVPDIDSYVGLMHTLFTLEDNYGLIAISSTPIVGCP